MSMPSTVLATIQNRNIDFVNMSCAYILYIYSRDKTKTSCEYLILFLLYSCEYV